MFKGSNLSLIKKIDNTKKMDFVVDSLKTKQIDVHDWFEEYVHHDSDLYVMYKASRSDYISNIHAELNILPYYILWLAKIHKYESIKIEKMVEGYCFEKITRRSVIIDGINMATIKKIKGRWYYIDVPFDALVWIHREYMQQLC